MSIQTQIDRITGEVSSQEALLNQALTLIDGKAAGGSGGGNSGPYSYAEEFIWTAPSDIKSGGATVSIPHSLGVEPDGYHIMALETEAGTSTEHIINNIIYDSQYMLYAGMYPFIFSLAIGSNSDDPSAGMRLDVGFEYCTSTNIGFVFSSDIQIIPKDKQYRVLVYKR